MTFEGSHIRTCSATPHLTMSMRARLNETHIVVNQILSSFMVMGWLRLVGSLELKVSFAKEPYRTDYILQKRLVI